MEFCSKAEKEVYDCIEKRKRKRFLDLKRQSNATVAVRAVRFCGQCLDYETCLSISDLLLPSTERIS